MAATTKILTKWIGSTLSPCMTQRMRHTDRVPHRMLEQISEAAHLLRHLPNLIWVLPSVSHAFKTINFKWIATFWEIHLLACLCCELDKKKDWHQFHIRAPNMKLPSAAAWLSIKTGNGRKERVSVSHHKTATWCCVISLSRASIHQTYNKCFIENTLHSSKTLHSWLSL